MMKPANVFSGKKNETVKDTLNKKSETSTLKKSKNDNDIDHQDQVNFRILSEKLFQRMEHKKSIDKKIKEMEDELQNMKYASYGVDMQINEIEQQLHNMQRTSQADNHQQELNPSNSGNAEKSEDKQQKQPKCSRCNATGHLAFKCNSRVESQTEEARRAKVMEKFQQTINQIKNSNELDEDKKKLETKKIKSKIFFIKKEWREIDINRKNQADPSTGRSTERKTTEKKPTTERTSTTRFEPKSSSSSSSNPSTSSSSSSSSSTSSRIGQKSTNSEQRKDERKVEVTTTTQTEPKKFDWNTPLPEPKITNKEDHMPRSNDWDEEFLKSELSTRMKEITERQKLEDNQTEDDWEHFSSESDSDIEKSKLENQQVLAETQVSERNTEKSSTSDDASSLTTATTKDLGNLNNTCTNNSEDKIKSRSSSSSNDCSRSSNSESSSGSSNSASDSSNKTMGIGNTIEDESHGKNIERVVVNHHPSLTVGSTESNSTSYCQKEKKTTNKGSDNKPYNNNKERANQFSNKNQKFQPKQKFGNMDKRPNNK